MMRFAAFTCPNPNCRRPYEAAIEDGYHAECPNCHQVNRIPGQVMSKEISGLCDLCSKPLDEHIYGRLTFCCPPKKGTST